MHQTGVRMTNEVIRNNNVVHESKVDVFEFDQQGGFSVPQVPYQIQAGDAFRTSCYYRDGNDFGLSSQEEMCVAFVMYYPAKRAFNFPWICAHGMPFPVCGEELVSKDLSSDKELNRSFGTPGSTCSVSSFTPAPVTPQPTTGGPTKAPLVSPPKSPTRTPVDGGVPGNDPLTPAPTTKLTNAPSQADSPGTTTGPPTRSPTPADTTGNEGGKDTSGASQGWISWGFIALSYFVCYL